MSSSETSVLKLKVIMILSTNSKIAMTKLFIFHPLYLTFSPLDRCLYVQ